MYYSSINKLLLSHETSIDYQSFMSYIYKLSHITVTLIPLNGLTSFFLLGIISLILSSPKRNGSKTTS